MLHFPAGGPPRLAAVPAAVGGRAGTRPAARRRRRGRAAGTQRVAATRQHSLAAATDAIDRVDDDWATTGRRRRVWKTTTTSTDGRSDCDCDDNDDVLPTAVATTITYR